MGGAWCAWRGGWQESWEETRLRTFHYEYRRERVAPVDRAKKHQNLERTVLVHWARAELVAGWLAGQPCHVWSLPADARHDSHAPREILCNGGPLRPATARIVEPALSEVRNDPYSLRTASGAQEQRVSKATLSCFVSLRMHRIRCHDHVSACLTGNLALYATPFRTRRPASAHV